MTKEQLATLETSLNNINDEGKVTLGQLKTGQIVKQVEKAILGKMSRKQYLSRAYELDRDAYPANVCDFMKTFQQIGWQSAVRLIDGKVIDPTNAGKTTVADYQVDVYTKGKTAEELTALRKIMTKIGFFELLNLSGANFQHPDLICFRNTPRKEVATLDINQAISSFDQLTSLASAEQLD